MGMECVYPITTNDAALILLSFPRSRSRISWVWSNVFRCDGAGASFNAVAPGDKENAFQDCVVLIESFWLRHLSLRWLRLFPPMQNDPQPFKHVNICENP
jgi:hypothetical protein